MGVAKREIHGLTMSIDKKEVNKRLGAAVKDARRVAQLSQQDLAEQLRMTRASVSLIESGAQSVNVSTLLEISLALNVTAADLLSTVTAQANDEAAQSKHTALAGKLLRKHFDGASE